MTKGEAKAQALRWLDEATLNGQSASAELTADYTDKFNYFIWNVLVYISNIFKLPRTVILKENELTEVGGFYRYKMPEDFMNFNKINVYNKSSVVEVYDYIRETTNTYLIPKYYFGKDATVEVLYWGMPAEIPHNAPEGTELEVAPKAIQLVPLRLAIEATAGSDETNAISTYLEAKFGNMVENLLDNDNDYGGLGIERVYAL